MSTDFGRATRSPRPHYIWSTTLFLLSLALTASSQPPAKPAVISYEKEVKPILTARCAPCHGNGAKLGGFSIASRADFLKGGGTHPVVTLGSGANSFLIKLVSGQVPGKIMPATGPRLTAKEIAVLRLWIDQGLSFGASKAAAAWRPPLAPRRPTVPAVRPGRENPIDRLLQPYFAARKIAPRAVVDDRGYARRVYLDLIGLLPTPEQLRAFLADTRPDKRARLARALLADDRGYAEHWLTFWNDMLRNDYAGTGYIDGGRTQITDWLYRALETNLPYDRFVSELVNPTPESAGFVKGIVWRGVVNASQTPEMQAAQNISQVFMGVNLKCASCHDSFISDWKLTDAYGMAAIYAVAAPEIVRCDKPTGKTASVRFLYPQLGGIDGGAPREQRTQQLAALLTSRSNGRLTRTLVNRLWARLMGRGLVEPTDEMDNRPWNPDLLDWLAADFADGGFDVKKTIEHIVTSRAYQLPAMSLTSEQTTDFVFTGPVVKRLSAEQFADAVSSLTGVWPRPANQYRITKGVLQVPSRGRASVVYQSGSMTSGAAEIDVDVAGAQVLSLIVTDGGNGSALDWANWIAPRLIGPEGETKLTDLAWRSATTGYGKVQIGRSIVEKPLRLGDKTFADGIGTHANSVISYLLPPGVTRFRATVGPDTGAVEQKGAPTAIAFYVVTGERALLESRAALALADPLLRALGRPNREQVVTQRSTVATTLQALELTNGATLYAQIGTGAARWAASESPTRLVAALYEHALGRPPTAAEQRTAAALVGTPVTKEGVEDLLWALTMLPEFQLIY